MGRKGAKRTVPEGKLGILGGQGTPSWLRGPGTGVGFGTKKTRRGLKNKQGEGGEGVTDALSPCRGKKRNARVLSRGGV